MADNQATPAPRPEFIHWPIYGLWLTAALLPLSEELPEAGEVFERVRREISPDLVSNLADLNSTGVSEALAELHLAQAGLGQSVDQFLAWAANLAPAHFAATAAQDAEVTRGKAPASLRGPSVNDGLAEWQPQKPDAKARERVRRLLGSPRELQRFAVATLTALWKSHLRTTYALHEGELRQAVSIFAALPVSTHPVNLISELVKRPVPGLAETLATAQRLLLVPLPYLGPYVVSRSAETCCVVAFDALRALRLHRGLDADLDLASLKVLADETRLRILRFVAGGERFGGEIVAHLGIAQPGVSRHLRLMSASGLLNVRQRGAVKYYSLRREALDALAHRIRDLGGSEKQKDGVAS